MFHYGPEGSASPSFQLREDIRVMELEDSEITIITDIGKSTSFDTASSKCGIRIRAYGRLRYDAER
jgi:hypothetical protein